MNSNVKTMLGFIFGGIVGSGLTFVFLKKKYDKMYEESVSSAMKVYSEVLEKLKDYTKEGEGDEESELLAKLNREKPDLSESAKDVAKNHEYVDYRNISHGLEPEKNRIIDPLIEEPDYIQYIEPQFFGEYPDYGQSFFTHYADGVLEDQDHEIMDHNDILDTVGIDYEDHFGEFEDDSVHVRNDRTKCYYEILEDTRTYDKALRDRRLES